MTPSPQRPAWSEPMTLEEAILFGFFIHQCSEAISHNIVDDEGYFPISEIKRDALPMLREQRQRAMVSLMIRGYLALKRNVSSNTKLYKVYIDSLLNDIQPSWPDDE